MCDPFLSAPAKNISCSCCKSMLTNAKQLSFLDRFLTLWILIAAGFGLGLGQLTGMRDFIAETTIGSTNVLIAAGLLVMMYPPLAKVRWNAVYLVFADWRLLLLTTVQNWILGPFIMFFLSSAFFHNEPGFMAGLSLVGCARCIAMVIVWNSLADGDVEYCAAIVALNSLITIVLYSPYAVLFINVLPKALSLASSEISLSIADVAQNVAIYMGIPFFLAVTTWFALTRLKGQEWYYHTFTPQIGVFTLVALLFTVVILFASQSQRITSNIGDVLYAAVPILLYFIIMFTVTIVSSFKLGASYPQSVTLAFTAASNNFELALAIAVSTFGLESDPALMSVVGALIEIPSMLALVNISPLFKKVLYRSRSKAPSSLTSKSSKMNDSISKDSLKKSISSGNEENGVILV